MMIIVDEKPFRFVESRLFNFFCKTLQPRHEKLSRNTIKRDCMKIYEEKQKMRTRVNEVSIVCLTTDTWKSRRTKSYMSLTTDYVDKNWKMQKKVLGFRCFPPSHTWQALTNMMPLFLREWGLENTVFTSTLDNIVVNDNTKKIFKMSFMRNNTLCLPYIFHVRCCAHVLNLIVQYGLEHIKSLINNVWESAQCIQSSASRKLDFETSLAQFGLLGKKEVMLDVSTRWNSTYMILKAAKEIRPAFAQYADTDPNYKWRPDEEWNKYEHIEGLLEKFY